MTDIAGEYAKKRDVPSREKQQRKYLQNPRWAKSTAWFDLSRLRRWKKDNSGSFDPA